MSFVLPGLSYPYDGLEPYIDRATMEIHHSKHHAAYVNNLNEALAEEPKLLELPVEGLLQNLEKVPDDVSVKVRNNAGGHANHSLFWKIMAPGMSEVFPKGPLLEALTGAFGSMKTFKEKFSQVALARFGSGWAWLTISGGKLQIEDTPNQDSPFSQGKTPILAIDVWEHAYYLKYQNRRADYIEAWWHVVKWEQVQENFNTNYG